MFNRLKLSTWFLIMGVVWLVACSEDNMNLKDGDHHITSEIHEVISDYIVKKYSSSYSQTEKQFEVHKIYGSSETDGVLSVYMWSFYAGFNKSTGVEEQAGHSLPAVIRLSKKDENYSVIEYKEPQDGSYYQSSLEKMFPKKYLKLAHRDVGNIGDLQKMMEYKVMEWIRSNSE